MPRVGGLLRIIACVCLPAVIAGAGGHVAWLVTGGESRCFDGLTPDDNGLVCAPNLNLLFVLACAFAIQVFLWLPVAVVFRKRDLWRKRITLWAGGLTLLSFVVAVAAAAANANNLADAAIFVGVPASLGLLSTLGLPWLSGGLTRACS
jgi:hypothetical protein